MAVKPNSTPSADSRQLSIFTPQFDERIRRIEIDGVMCFSILDVFQHYGSKGSADNPTKYWKRAEKRLLKQGSDLPGVVQRPIERGGRPTPFAPFKFFLRLVQVVEIAEWENIRQWMAEVANERIEETANPELGITRAEQRYIESQRSQGLSEAQAQQALSLRRDGKVQFKLLTDAIQAVVDQPNYAQIVNAEYEPLFGKLAAQLEIILKTDSVRDALPALQLQYVRTADMKMRELLRHADRMDNARACHIMCTIATKLGEDLQEFCEMLGIDRITGARLLNSGKRHD